MGLRVSAGPPTEPGSGTVGGGARVFGPTVGPLVGGVSSYVAGCGFEVSRSWFWAVVSGLDLAELTEETEVPWRWYWPAGSGEDGFQGCWLRGPRRPRADLLVGRAGFRGGLRWGSRSCCWDVGWALTRQAVELWSSWG